MSDLILLFVTKYEEASRTVRPLFLICFYVTADLDLREKRKKIVFEKIKNNFNDFTHVSSVYTVIQVLFGGYFMQYNIAIIIAKPQTAPKNLAKCFFSCYNIFSVIILGILHNRY
jgi:hypothetical protein